jgi:hypothetical protein
LEAVKLERIKMEPVVITASVALTASLFVEVHRTNGEEKGELHQNEKQIWNQPKNQEYYALAD